jgi:hypothetical protein
MELTRRELLERCWLEVRRHEKNRKHDDDVEDNASGETDSEPTSRAPSVLSIDPNRVDPHDDQDYSTEQRNGESSLNPQGGDRMVAWSDRGDSGDKRLDKSPKGGSSGVIVKSSGDRPPVLNAVDRLTKELRCRPDRRSTQRRLSAPSSGVHRRNYGDDYDVTTREVEFLHNSIGF